MGDDRNPAPQHCEILWILSTQQIHISSVRIHGKWKLKGYLIQSPKSHGVGLGKEGADN